MNNCKDQDYMLGIDIGTSSIKCSLVSLYNNSVTSAKQTYEILHSMPGYAEIRCDVLYAAIKSCLHKLFDSCEINAAAVRSIGICALCPGLLAVDENGNTISNAIIFMDTRSEKYAADIRSLFDNYEYFNIVGNRIMPGANALSSIMWLQDYLVSNGIHASKYVQLTSWLGYLFTGVWAMDRTSASAMGIMNIISGEWSELISHRSGISLDELPALRNSSDALGNNTNADLIALGIPRDAVVATGSGDTACTALALGIHKHGQMLLSLGTSAVVTGCSFTPKFDDRITNRRHILPDRWLYNAAMSSPGASLRWFRDEICPPNTSYSDIDTMVQSEPHDANGLLFLPYMSGERSPVFDPKARGVFMGLSLSTTRASLARAILNGAAYGIRQLMEIMYVLLDSVADDSPLCVVGGGSNNTVWSQIIANVTGRAVKTMRADDSAAVGAALIGGMAAHLVIDEPAIHYNSSAFFEPQREYKDMYDEQYEMYLKMYPAFKQCNK